MNTTIRELELRRVSESREVIALPPEVIADLDRSLRTEWAIDFHEAAAIEELLPRDSPYFDAHDALVEAITRELSAERYKALEAKLYSAIAEPGISGAVTSQRRAFILDSIALVLGIVKRLNIQGEILDVGSHIGFAASILAKALPNKVVAIDPSQAAIDSAISHPSTDERVEFRVKGLPWETSKRFELIFAISSMPELQSGGVEFLRGLGDLLLENGVAIVTSAWWHDIDVERIRSVLNRCKLGFGYADIVGGFQGIPAKFETEGVVILVKGGQAPFPRNVVTEMEREWSLFRDYANDARTKRREKTQAFERSYRAGKL